MTERSSYWADVNIGDGSISPYDDDEFSDIWRILFQRDRTTQGYIDEYLNELAVSNPSGNTIRVTTGAALVDGKFYTNDSTVDNVIATPAVSTRFDRVVLRKSWAAQTVRVAILTGIEGGGVPALTQNDGVTWEIPLATVQITTAPVITITDERQQARSPLGASEDSGMELIRTITSDGLSSSFDFQNIPQTYTHLFLIGNCKTDGANLVENLSLRFNNDSAANYKWQNINGANVAATAASAINDNEVELGFMPGGGAGATRNNSFHIYVSNYADGTKRITLTAQCANIPSNAAADFDLTHTGGQWAVQAVTRIEIFSSTRPAGIIPSGLVVSLYGLM
jgi:hypothetical protein